jgi:hypothetical protein
MERRNRCRTNASYDRPKPGISREEISAVDHFTAASRLLSTRHDITNHLSSQSPDKGPAGAFEAFLTGEALLGRQMMCKNLFGE